MLNHPPLKLAIERYRVAIVALEDADEHVSAEQVLEVLFARAQVQALLSQKSQWTFDKIIRAFKERFARKPRARRRHFIRLVKELDARLTQQMEPINQVVNLEDWRRLLNPPEREWLRLVMPPEWSDRYNWLWQGLSIAFVTASLSLLADISTRFLTGGPDAVGAFSVMLPAVIALLTGGGALTKTGQQAMEHILSSLRVAKHWWDEVICLVAWVLLVTMVGFWFALPRLSQRYTQLGDRTYYCENTGKGENCKWQLARAERYYNRAIALDPGNADAHHKLGHIQEELQELGAATTHYKIAAKAGIAEAYNDLLRLSLANEDYKSARAWVFACLGYADGNQPQVCEYEALARAYIQAGKYAEAIAWLRNFDAKSRPPNNGVMSPEQRDKQYKIFTYSGWALMGLKQYTSAEIELRKAIALVDDRAAAYCLLAQVLEKQQKPQAVNEAWEQCVSYASQKDSDEAIWITLALQHFARKENPKASN
jgi:tetratricopeptide (TPR) repeat protein